MFENTFKTKTPVSSGARLWPCAVHGVDLCKKIIIKTYLSWIFLRLPFAQNKNFQKYLYNKFDLKKCFLRIFRIRIYGRRCKDEGFLKNVSKNEFILVFLEANDLQKI